MKCLKCGYVTSESKENCARCGSPLPAKASARSSGTPRPAAPSVTPAAPLEPVPAADPVPDWRKEVSRKVKEYGEKKRILTTPPHALKDADARPVDPDPEPPVLQEPPRPRFATAAFSRVEPPEPEFPAPDSAPQPPPAPREPGPDFRVPRQLPPFDEEIYSGDLNEELFLDETGEEEVSDSRTPLYLGRRTAALAVDSTILIALHAGLLYLCAEIINYNFHDLFLEAWLPLAGIFLLFHCLYYAYFYKTSRQTPGQVFFKIELRDPLTGTISLRKILVRWLCLVCLSFLNLIPLLLGRRFLLLDRLSGTTIRTFK